ncbi:MAG: hypothetical protein K0S29_989 [Gammaproteobacteria bacterium]|nr:hypothetical protein [Gammaproteobacteria bacterium]
MYQDKHPKSLWVLSASSIFYCFAFGTITSLLTLYLIQKLGMKSADAYNLFAALLSLLFTLPLLGGFLGQRLGYKTSIIAGSILCMVSCFLLCLPDLVYQYLGIAGFAAGNAFVTPNMYALVGLGYKEHDINRNSGYTLYYLIFNFGFLASIFSAGIIAQYFGYPAAFALSGILLLVSIAIFIGFKHWIISDEGPKNLAFSSISLTVLGLGLSVLAFVLLRHLALNNVLLWILVVGASIGMLYYAFKQKDKIARYKMLALLILCILSIGFWSLYMLEPSLLTVFIAQNVNRHLFNFTIPASSYYSLDSFFVIILGFFFSWLWKFLAKRNQEPSLPTKFALSLTTMGAGYLVFVLGIMLVDNQAALVNSGWIVLGYALLASAELMISPIGLSMIGVLMPKGNEGLGMGIWQTFTGLSGIISGYLANLAVTPDSGTPVQTNPIFAASLLKIGLGTVIIGVIAACLVPFIKKLLKSPV